VEIKSVTKKKKRRKKKKNDTFLAFFLFGIAVKWP